MTQTVSLRLLAVYGMLSFTACKEKTAERSFSPTDTFNHAEQLFYANHDSAFYYFNAVTNTSSDSLELAMAYANMGTIQSRAGDFYGAQENLLQALQLLEQTPPLDSQTLVSVYNSLGNTSLELKNYNNAITYFDKALPLMEEKTYQIIVLNNKAVAYQRKHEYEPALNIYQSILKESSADSTEYARILSNLAKTKWLTNNNYPANHEYWIALGIRERAGDKWGLNASYAHLADFYATKQPDSALYYAGKMYAMATSLNSAEDKREALQKLITHSGTVTAKAYFIQLTALTDSIQSSRNAAKNQFALIRYEAEKTKADNLQLTTENAVKEVELLQHRVAFFSALTVLVLATYWLYWRNKKARQKLQEQHEKNIKAQQLKTSQKIHDVVANGIYRVMTAIEHGEHIKQADLLDQLESLYDKSRNISYDETSQPANETDFAADIHLLLGSMAGAAVKLYIVGNESKLWKKMSPKAREELIPILQELMVNMKKHSSATTVTVKFQEENGWFFLHYKDDGVGLGTHFYKGNGLQNTGNRILSMGGQLSFDRTQKNGLKIQVQIPMEEIS